MNNPPIWQLGKLRFKEAEWSTPESKLESNAQGQGFELLLGQSQNTHTHAHTLQEHSLVGGKALSNAAWSWAMRLWECSINPKEWVSEIVWK